MQGTILLNSSENTRKIEEEEKSRFIKGIIESIGIPLEGIWDDEELSLDKRMQLRELFSNYNVKVIDHHDGTLEIYVDNDLIAEWKKCKYLLKKDISTTDPSKKLYLEMQTDYWSIFENTG